MLYIVYFAYNHLIWRWALIFIIQSSVPVCLLIVNRKMFPDIHALRIRVKISLDPSKLDGNDHFPVYKPQ